MNRMLLLVGISALVGVFMLVKKVVQEWGTTLLVLVVFCILTVYGLGRLYSYGVNHPHG